MARLPKTRSAVGPRAVRAEADAIARQLRAMADPARAASVQNFFKEPVSALGIPSPALRQFARTWLRERRATWTAAPAITLCDRLLAEPELEIRAVGFLLLAGFHRELGATFVPTARRWLERRLDNWALVDGFCGEVLARILPRLPALERALRRWSRARRLWVRRASLVALVPSARHGERLDLAYALAAEHLRDPEDLMHKATGWLLREAGRRDRPRLRHFLLEHRGAIPRTALRYALEHFPPEERRHLLAATRGA